VTKGFKGEMVRKGRLSVTCFSASKKVGLFRMGRVEGLCCFLGELRSRGERGGVRGRGRNF